MPSSLPATSTFPCTIPASPASTLPRLLPSRTVAFCNGAVFVEMARGPKQPARNQIQVAGVGDRGCVVADGRAEDARLFWAVIVHPGDHEIIRQTAPVAARHQLSSPRDDASVIEHVNIIVMLLLDGRPIAQSVCNGQR